MLIYVVKKYGASIGEFANKLNEQKNCRTKRRDETSFHEANQWWDWDEKAAIIPGSNASLPFLMYRGITTQCLEVILPGMTEWSIQKGQESPGVSYIYSDYDALEVTKSPSPTFNFSSSAKFMGSLVHILASLPSINLYGNLLIGCKMAPSLRAKHYCTDANIASPWW